MDNTVKKWILNGLVNGLAINKLKPFIEAQGIPFEEAAKDIIEPLSMEAARLKKRLLRCESLLKTIDAQLRTDPNYSIPQKVKLPPFAQFITEYYYPHRMGFFDSVIDSWEARNWTPQSLVEKVGTDTLVQIQHGREGDEQYEANFDEHKKEIKFGDFIGMVEGAEFSNDFYMTARNFAINNETLKALKKDLGEDIGDGYLCSSPHNNTLYLWIGPKGAVTPLHYDPSNHMYIHIYGAKIFRFVPALQIPYMYNNHRMYSDVDLLNPDLERYPEFAKATIIELHVNPGDCLYIPAGWWHHAVSTSPSIGISVNQLKLTNSFGKNGLVDYPQGMY